MVSNLSNLSCVTLHVYFFLAMYTGMHTRHIYVQLVVFERAVDMVRCLEVIAADPFTEVVRVKNGYDPCYDADRSTGYR